MRPLLHERTLDELSRLSEKMPHAMVLEGVPGMGLKATAQYVAQLAGSEVEWVYPERKEVVDTEKGSITIEIIRRLYERTGTKSAKPRCIVITSADTMGHSAQNAFLKLLEEPTPQTTFMLLVHERNRLLPTVKSRVQFYQVRALTDAQSQQLLDRLNIDDEARRRQLLFLAGGRPSLLHKLASDEKAFETEATLLRQAKTMVQGTAYQRLVAVQAVASSREDALRLVNYAMTLLRFDVVQRSTADPATLTLLSRLEHAAERLAGNGNIRLVLAAAVM